MSSFPFGIRRNRDLPAAPLERVFGSTSLMLLLAAITSFLLAALVAFGWLALGERANISRREFNPFEIAVIVGGIFWGLLSLLTLRASANTASKPVASYFESRGSFSLPIIFPLITLVSIGVLFGFLALQILTGGISLATTTNIAANDLNWIEIAALIGSAFWAIICLRTAYAFIARDKAAPAWAQWVLLVSGLIGVVYLLSAAFDAQLAVVPVVEGLTAPSSWLLVAGVLAEIYAPAALLLFSALGAYQLISAERDVRADQAIRNILSRTPGAGGIVGFIAIFIFFSVASDLFLEPRALAGALTTNVTRGVVAIGITLLMISGEFDLSVGSQLGSIGLFFLLAMTEGFALSALLFAPVAIILLMQVTWKRNSPLFRMALTAATIAVIIGAIFIDPSNIIVASVIPAAFIALMFGTLLGLINGTLLITTGIPSFIVTLGTLLAYRAIPLVIVAEGRILRYADYRLPQPSITVSNLVIIAILAVLFLVVAYVGFTLLRRSVSAIRQRIANYRTNTEDFRDFFLFANIISAIITVITAGGIMLVLGAGILDLLGKNGADLVTVDIFALLNGQFWFLPAEVNLRTSVLWWFVLVLIFQFILTQTPYGSYTFAVGGNPGAARAQGISVNGIKVLNFVICSWMVAIAAIMDVARVQSVDSTRGDGLELEVIAASVIGGTLLTGGYGSIFGALLGVFIFGMLRTGLVLIGLNPRIFNGVIGVIIVVAVIINTFVRRERR